jgi:hypothetical protein
MIFGLSLPQDAHRSAMVINEKIRFNFAISDPQKI